jgi:hypothetical protein
MTPATNKKPVSNSLNTPTEQQIIQKTISKPKNGMLVGSRILESDQQSAILFSQDLNHFSVGSKSSSPTKQN